MQYADDNLAAWRVSGLSKPKVTLSLDAKGPPTVGSGVMNLIPHFYKSVSMKVRIEIDTETDKVEVKKDEKKVESQKTMNLNEVVKEEVKGQAINE